MRGVETVLLLVVLGTVVAAFAGRLQIPAPSLLVIAGLLTGLLPGVPAVRVAPDAVSLVVLPPLLYAARLYHNSTVSAATRQRLQHNLDLEATRLSDEPH